MPLSLQVSEFNAIKAMQEEGFNVNAARLAAHKSWSTVDNVFKASNYDEYKDISKNYSARWREQHATTKQEQVTLPVVSSGDELMDKTIAMLEERRDTMVAHFNSVIAALKEK